MQVLGCVRYGYGRVVRSLPVGLGGEYAEHLAVLAHVRRVVVPYPFYGLEFFAGVDFGCCEVVGIGYGVDIVFACAYLEVIGQFAGCLVLKVDFLGEAVVGLAVVCLVGDYVRLVAALVVLVRGIVVYEFALGVVYEHSQGVDVLYRLARGGARGDLRLGVRLEGHAHTHGACAAVDFAFWVESEIIGAARQCH